MPQSQILLADLFRFFWIRLTARRHCMARRRVTSWITDNPGPRNKVLASATVRRWAVILSQSSAAESSLERCWAADVRHLACITGLQDWMDAGFVWPNQAGVALALGASESRAPPSFRKACWGTTLPHWLHLWQVLIAWLSSQFYWPRRRYLVGASGVTTFRAVPDDLKDWPRCWE